MQTNGEKFGSPQCLDIKPMLPALAHVGQATGALGLNLTWRQDSGDSPKKPDRTHESKCSIWMNACTCRPQRTTMSHTLHVPGFTPHSTLYTSHFRLHTLRFKLHSVRFTLTVFTSQSTPRTPHSALSTHTWTLHALHSTLSKLSTPQPSLSPHSVPTPQSPVSSLQSPLRTPHFPLHTLRHSALHTPRSIFHTPLDVHICARTYIHAYMQTNISTHACVHAGAPVCTCKYNVLL